MVDITAAIVGGVLGGLLLLTLIYAVVITGKYRALAPPSPATGPGLLEKLAGIFGPAYDYIVTWFSLFPYVFFLAGPVIDAISSQFMYSKASLVGAATVLITAIFGSNKFAEISSSLLGMFPPLRSPSGVPGVPADWNWWMLGVYLIIGVAIFVPIMVGGLSSWAWWASIGIAFLFTALVLAGNDLLGDVTPSAAPAGIDSSTSFAGVTIADVCAPPGLGCLQTSFAPLGILLNTSILTSHVFESLDTGNRSNAITTGSLTLGAFILEWFTLGTKGCIQKYKYGHFSPILSLGLGTLAGYTAYNAMKTFSLESFTQSYTAEGIFHPPPAPEKPKSSSGSSERKIVIGPQPETNEPVDDQDAFVCEAYKDGELVTSTIVE